MTVKELIKELREYPSDMTVTVPVDWDNVDEFGNIEVAEIEHVIEQVYPDVQFGDNEVRELMLCY